LVLTFSLQIQRKLGIDNYGNPLKNQNTLRSQP
jgi:hypothetical protein